MTQRIVDADRVGAELLQWTRDELEDTTIELTDNFLDVGGHSLAAAHINQKMSDRFGLRIPIQFLFEKTLRDACTEAIPAH